MQKIDETAIREDGAVAADDEQKQYATWEDMCQPPEPVEVQLRNGTWIKFLPWLSQDRLSEIQRACGMGRKNRDYDSKKFVQLVLKEVMIEPRVRTDADRRAILKADASIVSGIINRVVDTETFERLQEDLGES